MSRRSFRMMPVGDLFARSGPPLPRTYAAWPVWHDSTPADVKFHPLPKKQAVRFWHEARRFGLDPTVVSPAAISENTPKPDVLGVENPP